MKKADHTDTVLSLLPSHIRDYISCFISENNISTAEITEIRLRRGKIMSLSLINRNIRCNYISDENDIKQILAKLCKGSYYALSDSISQGYITYDGGVRVGLIGHKDTVDSGTAPENISSLNIRIPRHIRGISSKIYDFFLRYRCGLLIFSPPSEGKTTLLRDLAIELSRGNDPLKVALIDSRFEFDDGMIPSDSLIDIYSGYSKSQGIEIATRTMSSDVIICDEIGSNNDVNTITDTKGRGIPLIASTHARSFFDIKGRSRIYSLMLDDTFPYAIKIERNDNGSDFSMTIYDKDGNIIC